MECTQCRKWRFLSEVLDPSCLPPAWSCSKESGGSCAAPQQEWSREDEDRFVECKFTVGSVVWAKLCGFSWWPALVDDDPDTEMFFWTEPDSQKVTW